MCYCGGRSCWLQLKHARRGKLRRNEGKRVLRTCRATQCIQRMQNMTSEADKDKQKATAPWQTIWVTPNSPRTNGSDCPGHQEAPENSFCCLGCARGQTFTSTSDRNSRLKQNMHAENAESASADGKFIKWYSVRTLPQSSGQLSESNIRMLF